MEHTPGTVSGDQHGIQTSTCVTCGNGIVWACTDSDNAMAWRTTATSEHGGKMCQGDTPGHTCTYVDGGSMGLVCETCGLMPPEPEDVAYAIGGGEADDAACTARES